MKSNKEHRFEQNPKEKELHDQFKKMFENDDKTLSAIIFGWSDSSQNYPSDYLSEREQNICLNLIQWLGSPVGQSFLENCRYINN